MMSTTFFTLLASATLLTACSTGDADGKYNGYEMPAYTVKAQDGEFELRHYSPYLVAEVSVEGERSEALSSGFRILAGYIFGKNESSGSIAMTVPVTQTPTPEKSEKIAMTVPVSQTQAGENRWLVQFTMPAKYTLESLPKAKDERIRFHNVPEKTMAVVRFSGRTTASTLALKEQALKDQLAARKLVTIGSITHAYYNDPWTFPWNRRNEVMVAVK